MIFWAVMVFLALTLLILYIKNVQKKIAGLDLDKTKEEMHLPFLEEEFKKMPGLEAPRIEMPEIDQEKLQEIGQTIEEKPAENNHCKPTD